MGLFLHRCGAPPRRANSWLPPEKQFLLTKGVACHKRVKDIELALSAQVGRRDLLVGDAVLQGAGFSRRMALLGIACLQAREDEGGWLLPLADEDSPPPVSLHAASGCDALELSSECSHGHAAENFGSRGGLQRTVLGGDAKRKSESERVRE